MISRRVGGHSALAKPEDVFERDNRGVNHHADGKGQPGKRNHIDRQSKPGDGDKCADHRHRDGGEDNDGRQDASQEQHQYTEGQKPADKDVLLHQVDGRGNIFRLVIDNTQVQVPHIQNAFVENVNLATKPFHGLDDIDPGRP